jgi:uridine kinase
MPQKISSKELLEAIKEQSKDSVHFVIAISGFGGSGKSTVASNFLDELKDATIIHVDDFITNHLSIRSADWFGIEWDRLKKEVLNPIFQNRDEIEYGVYDWKENEVIRRTSLSLPKYILVEGVGLIRNELEQYFDLSVWLNVPLDTATTRGKKRDIEEFGAEENNPMWDNVWIPNDGDYFKKHKPDTKVDFILELE